MEVALALKKGESDGQEVDINAFVANFEAALESECGSGLQVQTLQEIKDALLAEHGAQGAE